jgi:hypothetical protein
MDLKVNSTGDLDITNNRLSFVEDVEYIAQAWAIRLKTIMGEWILDQRIGIPYLQHVLVKNPNMNLVREIFRRATYSTPGIKEITFFEMSLNNTTRELSIEIAGITENLDTFRFIFNEMIIPINRQVAA